MSQDHDRSSKNQDYDEKKVAKARARKHKVSRAQFFYLLLLIGAVGVAIYIIESYR